MEKLQAVLGIDIPCREMDDGTVMSPLGECTVFLKKNYRFSAESALGQVAARIRAGGPVFPLKPDAAQSPSAHDADREVSVRSIDEKELPQALTGVVLDHFVKTLEAKSLEEAYGEFEAFRILCALREGPFGVGPINNLVENTLVRLNHIPQGTHLYRGKPLLITQNDYDVRLFNGDVGILWPDPDDGRLVAWFRQVDGTFRKVSVFRLPPYETAYAMTVHKSQGSEFSHVLLILPTQDSQVLTRELLYTAVTRARKRVDIWAHDAIVELAAQRVTDRSSGLCDRLWKIPRSITAI